MNKERFTYVCLEAEAGRDAFVRHPDSGEEGRVTSCIEKTGHVVVTRPDNETRCWDYRECNELKHTKIGPMI